MPGSEGVHVHTPGRLGGTSIVLVDTQVVYAGFMRRAAALLLDLALDGVFAAIVLQWTIAPASWLLFGAFLVIHHVGLAAEGGTIGKRVAGLRLVRVDGSRVGVWPALVRELVRSTASVGALGLGFLWMLDDRQRRTWHDLAAGTLVVRELQGQQGPPWRFDPPWRRATFAPAASSAASPPPTGRPVIAEPAPETNGDADATSSGDDPSF